MYPDVFQLEVEIQLITFFVSFMFLMTDKVRILGYFWQFSSLNPMFCHPFVSDFENRLIWISMDWAICTNRS